MCELCEQVQAIPGLMPFLVEAVQLYGYSVDEDISIPEFLGALEKILAEDAEIEEALKDKLKLFYKKMKKAIRPAPSRVVRGKKGWKYNVQTYDASA